MKFKKVLLVFVLICLLLNVNIISYAKDIALDVMENEHDYLMFATVSDIDDNFITVEFYDTLNKTEDRIPPSLKIEKFRYSYCSEHGDSFNNPKIGDNIFASVDKSGDVYTASAVYKTDTVDSRTLNLLVPADMENQECMTDTAALAYFIRNGGANITFGFADNTVSVMQDGKESIIYPTDAKTPVAIKYITGEGKNKIAEKKQDVIAVNPVIPEDIQYYKELLFGRRVIALGIIFSGIIIGMIVVYFTSNRRKRG